MKDSDYELIRESTRETAHDLAYRIVLVSHGSLAQSILESTQMLLGAQMDIAAYGFERDMSLEALKEHLKKELAEHGDEHVLFLTDLLNGSPFNIVAELARNHHVYHITGMNLALVLNSVLLQRGEKMSLSEICDRLMGDALHSIVDVEKLFRDLDEEEDD